MKTQARLGALALALLALLCAPIARAANDSFTVNGLPFITSVPGGYLSAFAAYFPNGLGTSINPFWITGSIGSTSSAAITNPSGCSISMTSATTAYGAGQLVANSATAGSVANSSFAIANAAGGAFIPRVRVSTNDATSTAWGGVSMQVDLWSASPTWTNGDRGAWKPATGTASHLAAYSCVMSAEYGDGAYAECAPTVGAAPAPKLAAGTTVYCSLEAVSASGVTGASKTWTITPELAN